MNIQIHFRKQVKYLLALLLFVCCSIAATAQSDSWLKGSWYGTKSFSKAHIGIKVLVRVEIDSVYKDHFIGRLIYMYPKDTIARLIRTFNGNIDGSFIRMNKSEELYLLDPRTRSFWSNCTQCNEAVSFSLSNNDLIFKIVTSGCGDSCAAETAFSRSLEGYDSVAKAEVRKLFKEQVTVVAKGRKKNERDKESGNKILVDTGRENAAITTASNINPANNTGTAATTNIATPDKVNTNSKTDSLAATANTNSKQKNGAAIVAKQVVVDSGKNNLTTTAISKNPSSTNSKTDSLTATANNNPTQKNGAAIVAKQVVVDSGKNNLTATAINKNSSNIHSKTDSLAATANINSKQKNDKSAVAKQSLIDSARNNKTIIAEHIKPATTSASSQNNTVAKAIVDTTKDHGPSSDSSALPPIIAAKTFILADTSNQFVSRADSVAMAKVHRETNPVNEYTVTDPHIQIELFDNGEIDSDRVSVYYNGRMLFNNVVLSYKPIAFVIDASGANRHHEFLLIAENEGSIPPNTALLRITSGKKQYKIFVSTNLSRNAKIAVDYTGD